MYYALNFTVEMLLVLTYDHDSTDQTMNDSPFYMMWVSGLEMQVTTSMNSFQYTFVANFEPFFMTKTFKNGKASLASTSIVNLMVGLMLLRW
jgi:hypothetical protein